MQLLPWPVVFVSESWVVEFVKHQLHVNLDNALLQWTGWGGGWSFQVPLMKLLLLWSALPLSCRTGLRCLYGCRSSWWLLSLFPGAAVKHEDSNSAMNDAVWPNLCICTRYFDLYSIHIKSSNHWDICIVQLVRPHCEAGSGKHLPANPASHRGCDWQDLRLPMWIHQRGDRKRQRGLLGHHCFLAGRHGARWIQLLGLKSGDQQTEEKLENQVHTWSFGS